MKSEHRRLLEQVIAETRGTADLDRLFQTERTGTARALAVVPRHRFVPPAQLAWAYADSPLPIGCGQTISPTFIVALMTELLALDCPVRGVGSRHRFRVSDGDAGQFGAAGVLGGADSRWLKPLNGACANSVSPTWKFASPTVIGAGKKAPLTPL